MNTGTLLLFVSIIWLGSEILLVRFRRSGPAEKRRDGSTLRILWFAIAVAVGGGIYLGSRSFGSFGDDSTISRFAGIVLIVAGMVVRWSAILTLKGRFTVDVAITRHHRLVTHGIYGRLRHPAYAGTLLSFLGLGLAFANWFSLLLMTLLVPAAFLHRIHVEERLLLEQFGADYERYCGTTRRLIPFLY